MKNQYFKNFDNVTIDNTTIKNIFTKIRIIGEESIYEYYSINNENAEDLALRFYNDKNLYWLIMSTNKNIDYFYGNVLSQKELNSYIDKTYDDNKYPNETIDEYSQRVSEMNDEQRVIRVIKRKYLPQVLDE